MKLSQQFKEEFKEYYRIKEGREEELKVLSKNAIPEKQDEDVKERINDKLNEIVVNKLIERKFRFGIQRLGDSSLLDLKDGKLIIRGYHERRWCSINFFYCNHLIYILNEISEEFRTAFMSYINELSIQIEKIKDIDKKIRYRKSGSYGFSPYRYRNYGYDDEKEEEQKEIIFTLKTSLKIEHIDDKDIETGEIEEIRFEDFKKDYLCDDEYYNLCLKVIEGQKELIKSYLKEIEKIKLEINKTTENPEKEIQMRMMMNNLEIENE